jgi:CubicO group peptidase (beta-lactamase class C family)
MIRTNSFHRLVLLLPLLTACALAQEPGGLSPETVRRVEEIVEAERIRMKIPGLSIAIAVDNRLRFARGYGMADLEQNVPAGPETVYRTGSIAKPITSTAVMQLAQEGRLDLDAPIQKYCPAFPEKNWPLTARHLLGHLGGIRHYRNSAESSGTAYYDSITSSLGLFKDEPLLHEPGTKFLYTTYGYSVLGCAVEGASGMSFEEYLRTKVFGPAGMNASGIDDYRRIIPRRARGYARMTGTMLARLSEGQRRGLKPDEIFNSTLHDTSMKVPGGGLVSTAPDLVRFALAMNQGTLVRPETRAQIWTQQKLRDGKMTDYGLGWSVGMADGEPAIYHSGGQSGVSTFLTLLPQRGLAIAVMSNLQDANVSELAIKVSRMLVSTAAAAGAK